MKGFRFLDVLGCGACGVVYKIYDPAYDREFALKSVLESKFNKNEIQSMQDVDDNNVIRLYGYDYYQGSVYLLMEYCPCSLEKFLKYRNSISNLLLIKYSMGILKSIRACHHANVAHLDIKPANFLIDQYDRIRVTDFGLSAKHLLNELDIQYAGSVPFMAPEILSKLPHDSLKADIWAIGVTFFIMATGKLPWIGNDRNTVCHNLMMMPPRIDLIENKEYAEIVNKCLQKDPEMRPTIDEMFEYPIFHEESIAIIKKPVHNTFIVNSRRTCSRSQISFICQPRLQKMKLH